jgi:tetratricopeptide (TPR) repeat protein
MGPDPRIGPDAYQTSAGDDLRAEVDQLKRRVQQNDDELDAMQIAAARGRAKWYREPAVLISVLSLVLAFGSTLVSTIRLDEDRRHQARAEVTNFISRLAEVSKQQVDLANSGSPNATNVISLLNGELLSIANQARTVMATIPNEIVTGEYVAVGYTFQTQGQFEAADDLYRQGLQRSSNPSDQIYALRSLGQVRFLAGDVASGRQLLQQALDVHKNDARTTALVIANEDATTHLYWANNELMAGQCTEAGAHLAAIQQIVAGQPLVNLGPLMGQLQQALTLCQPREITPVSSAEPF